MASAGRFITIVEPVTYIAPLGTALPSNNVPIAGMWPAGWMKVENTSNGVQLTFVNPQQDVTSEENGIIATLASGADTVNMTWQNLTPDEYIIRALSGLRKETIAPQPATSVLTLTGAATAAGDASITLPGVPPVTVALAVGDSPSQAATKIAAATYTGWTAVQGVGANNGKVTFMQNIPAPVMGSSSITLPAGLNGGLSDNPYFEGYSHMYLDPSLDNKFMVGIEGTGQAGGLRENSVRMRFFAYGVQQTDNPSLPLRSRGSDAVMNPQATVRCLPSDITPAQLAGTGITGVDPKKRFSWFMWENMVA